MKLISSILCANPELRATVPAIMADEWLNQSVDMSRYKWEEVVRDTEFHANNAGDIFRTDESKLVVNNKQNNNYNNNEQPRATRLEKINNFNETNDENTHFNSKLNQIALMSKSF